MGERAEVEWVGMDDNVLFATQRRERAEKIEVKERKKEVESRLIILKVDHAIHTSTTIFRLRNSAVCNRS